MTPTQSDLQRAAGWQPIESAPKDGTAVLLYFHEGDDEMAVMYWNETYKVWFGYYEGSSPTGIASHWMPLPAPPSGDA